MIVGASDRMISAPDIKFEPDQMKIYRFNEGVIALVAGDPYLQIAMCNDAAKAIDLKKSKGHVIDVETIALLYGEAFTKHRRMRAENRYLKPVGLDAQEFLARHQEWDGNFVAQTTSNMQHSPLDVETIIAGKDTTGYHIYIVDDPGDVRCADGIGFAAIGSGKNHADSQFMLARHSPQTFFHTALLQTYAAKRRAEVSPTVGGETDLFYIGNDGFQLLHEDLCKAVDDAYNGLEAVNAEARRRADGAVREFLNQHLDAAQRASEPSQPSERPPLPETPPPKPKRGRKSG